MPQSKSDSHKPVELHLAPHSLQFEFRENYGFLCHQLRDGLSLDLCRKSLGWLPAKHLRSKKPCTNEWVLVKTCLAKFPCRYKLS